MVYGNWYKIFRCIKCKTRMSFSTKMNSLATCPTCGENTGATICETEENTERKVYLTYLDQLFGIVRKKETKQWKQDE